MVIYAIMVPCVNKEKYVFVARFGRKGLISGVLQLQLYYKLRGGIKYENTN